MSFFVSSCLCVGKTGSEPKGNGNRRIRGIRGNGERDGAAEFRFSIFSFLFSDLKGSRLSMGSTHSFVLWIKVRIPMKSDTDSDPCRTAFR